MKRITLPGILESLLHLKDEIIVDPIITANARRAIERMIHLKKLN